MIRDLELRDLRLLEKEARFPMPNLNNKLYYIKKTIEEDNNPVASFWVKVTSELSLILKNELSPTKKAKIMLELDKFLKGKLTKDGMDDIHLFIEDEIFSHFLVKNFGFVQVPGQSLYRRV